ncbi:MAG TPA: PilZ domain-containing protein [Candidatus Krumholzibacteria bacterium]|nr:PilZ domain-containing protein [Candidatus Krumholzibacteria bacterium]
MSTSPQERRGATRVDANLKLQVQLPEGAAASLETINISSSGLYFRSDRFMEPMTKLALELEVGVPDGDGTALVPCEGLVVRTLPEAPAEGVEAYEVAVFFTHIAADAKATLERHIAMLLG